MRRIKCLELWFDLKIHPQKHFFQEATVAGFVYKPSSFRSQMCSSLAARKVQVPGKPQQKWELLAAV